MSPFSRKRDETAGTLTDVTHSETSSAAAHPPVSCAPRWLSVARISVGGGVIGILVLTYLWGIPTDGASLIDYFGYFTNQTSLLTSVVLIAFGWLTLAGCVPPHWLVLARAVATACMLIVGVIYNTLVPGTGSAPAWVSGTLHLVFPALVALDWFLVRDHPPLPWRQLWVVLPYPILWLVVVLVRGATDGWVPYGFLLPERGFAALVLSVAGLLGALVAAGTLVWAASRLRPVQECHSPRSASRGGQRGTLE